MFINYRANFIYIFIMHTPPSPPLNWEYFMLGVNFYFAFFARSLFAICHLLFIFMNALRSHFVWLNCAWRACGVCVIYKPRVCRHAVRIAHTHWCTAAFRFGFAQKSTCEKLKYFCQLNTVCCVVCLSNVGIAFFIFSFQGERVVRNRRVEIASIWSAGNL